MKNTFLVTIFLAGCTAYSALLHSQTRLLRNPDISENHIVFVYAGDIWIANVDGSQPRRLTVSQGMERDPYLSNDGRHVCFTAEYDGNTDVYLLPVEGGNPKRLTWHPTVDLARGWTPDDEVVFASGRTKVPVATLEEFWKIGKEGGLPERIVVPRLTYGEYNADGTMFAYQMVQPWELEFRHYRGGQNNPIRIMNLNDYSVVKVPWSGSIDQKPVWMGEEVFFLSDRDTIANVWSYHVGTKLLQQRTHFMDFDTKNIGAGGGRIIIENGSFLYVLDPVNGQLTQLHIDIKTDLAWSRPHWKNLTGDIQDASISPTGKRAVFSARGDIFTVPAEDGTIRNLTHSDGVADRDPSWSQDGRYVGWFSDESGEYEFHYTDQFGKNLKKVPLRGRSFYFSPAWSPNSKMISFTDGDRNIWLLTLETGDLQWIGNEGFDHPERTIYPEWSPDSKWIAYVARLKSEYNAIFAYSVAGQKSHQITDGMSNCISPAWDKGGKYLYFLASTNYGLNVGWLDMSSIRQPLEYGVYMAVLPADEPSPIFPKSDDEDIEEPKKDTTTVENKTESGEGDEEKEDSSDVVIDFDNLDQRIIALDIPVGTYNSIRAGEEKKLYLSVADPNSQSPGYELKEYNLEEKELKTVVRDIQSHVISFDGKKLLYRSGNNWKIEDLKPDLKGEGMLALSDLKLKIDPQAEWRQMFKESIRYQRDFFYVENVHGLDLDEIETTYSPWLDDVNHRSDLTYILDIIGGETVIGHSFVGGGDYPDVESVPGGLLGADYRIANGHYQIARIYQGENWNPDLQSPLSGPGIDVSEGDYILSVNGYPLTRNMNIYSLFDQTAGKRTVLEVSATPSRDETREVVVIPVENENSLRQRDWIDGNRKKVDELSDGRLAYVWLPNTGFGGYSHFNRYYFAQKHKQGAIIDERYNGGGYAADYIVDLLNRELMGYFNNSVGNKQPFTSPASALFGPKVMIINERAGSGGDYLPYMFKKKEIGPLVGTKTWGGLVGWGGLPPLIDGGFMGAPRWGFFNADGEWDVENVGVSPDYWVEQDPAEEIEGRDTQLEKAVEVALELLGTKGVELKKQPEDPVKVRVKKKK